MKTNKLKGYFYLLPALIFTAVFLLYPLFDVLIYSFEEGFNTAAQSYSGIGFYNYKYILSDPYFIKAVKNTVVIVLITVPVSTVFALAISLALSSVNKLRELFSTVFFLPYVTNTLAVGLVFTVLFDKTEYTDGLVNAFIKLFGGEGVDFIDGPYWAKMLVMCIYTIWIVLPFKTIVLTGALASVDKSYYNAAKIDGASRAKIFFKITLPLISPMIFYLVITGFIGAFKAYSDEVALFGTDLNDAGMNTVVGYIYDMLYGKNGGYPSFASAAAILLFIAVLAVTLLNLAARKKFSVRSSGR